MLKVTVIDLGPGSHFTQDTACEFLCGYVGSFLASSQALALGPVNQNDSIGGWLVPSRGQVFSSEVVSLHFGFFSPVGLLGLSGVSWRGHVLCFQTLAFVFCLGSVIIWRNRL